MIRKSATYLLEECADQSGRISAELLGLIRSPPHRLQLYKLLNRGSVQPFGELIRLLFREEMQYANALWEGAVEDRHDAYEGIYDCGYLLYRLGDPADVRLLWEAKWIDMDVGTGLGAEFFAGAGVEQTLR